MQLPEIAQELLFIQSLNEIPPPDCCKKQHLRTKQDFAFRHNLLTQQGSRPHGMKAAGFSASINNQREGSMSTLWQFVRKPLAAMAYANVGNIGEFRRLFARETTLPRTDS